MTVHETGADSELDEGLNSAPQAEDLIVHWQEYRDLAARCVAALLRDKMDTDHVAQDTIVKTWRYLDGQAEPTPIRSMPGWLIAAANRMAIDLIRTRLRGLSANEEIIEITEAEASKDGRAARTKWYDDPERTLETSESCARILEAVRSLEPADREIIDFMMDGASSIELAVKLGIERGAARMRIMRARQRLRDKLTLGN